MMLYLMALTFGIIVALVVCLALLLADQGLHSWCPTTADGRHIWGEWHDARIEGYKVRACRACHDRSKWRLDQ